MQIFHSSERTGRRRAADGISYSFFPFFILAWRKSSFLTSWVRMPNRVKSGGEIQRLEYLLIIGAVSWKALWGTTHSWHDLLWLDFDLLPHSYFTLNLLISSFNMSESPRLDFYTWPQSMSPAPRYQLISGSPRCSASTLVVIKDGVHQHL